MSLAVLVSFLLLTQQALHWTVVLLPARAPAAPSSQRRVLLGACLDRRLRSRCGPGHASRYVGLVIFVARVLSGIGDTEPYRPLLYANSS
jgi:hypothetical protein